MQKKKKRLEVNSNFGPYVLIKKLGQGSFGSVFEGENQPNFEFSEKSPFISFLFF